jgi:hypothetical protein
MLISHHENIRLMSSDPGEASAVIILGPNVAQSSTYSLVCKLKTLYSQFKLTDHFDFCITPKCEQALAANFSSF